MILSCPRCGGRSYTLNWWGEWACFCCGYVNYSNTQIAPVLPAVDVKGLKRCHLEDVYAGWRANQDCLECPLAECELLLGDLEARRILAEREERNKQIVLLRRNGASWEELGHRFHLSLSSLRWICRVIPMPLGRGDVSIFRDRGKQCQVSHI